MNVYIYIYVYTGIYTPVYIYIYIYTYIAIYTSYRAWYGWVWHGKSGVVYKNVVGSLNTAEE